MSEIYKINYIVNNKIKKIFVFVGSLKVKQTSTRGIMRFTQSCRAALFSHPTFLDFPTL